MLAVCAVGWLIVLINPIDVYGWLGSTPWYGWWDSNVAMTGRPYEVQLEQVRPDGASARAGLRNGDRLDLRDQPSFADRYWILTQPPATRSLDLVVHRGDSTFRSSFKASTTYDSAFWTKSAARFFGVLAAFWFLACSTLIAIRRPDAREARLLAIVMLTQAAQLALSRYFVLPWAGLSSIISLAAAACGAAGMVAFVRLSALYGTSHRWRTAVEWIVYCVAALYFLRSLLGTIGVATLAIDPLPYMPALLERGAFAVGSSLVGELALMTLTFVAIGAVATTLPSERPRTAWLLLPLPLAFALVGVLRFLTPLAQSWGANTLTVAFGNSVWLLGALTATYAVLKRRVFDIEFVLNRTVVVATVSLIVVGSFAILEWILGNVLVGVSHATGLLANGALALVLGLSMNPIHKRVDSFVDDVLFRKRHEDERALVAFGKEAGYVTEIEALLDRSIEIIRHHTDARDASILLDGNGAYSSVRSFGDGAGARADENDPAVLALKAWHKPLDPHRYLSALSGVLAVPMLGRGRRLGILLLGERTGSEAYAPDEVEALAHFAHGVGSAIEGLAHVSGNANSESALLGAIARLERKIDDIRGTN